MTNFFIFLGPPGAGKGTQCALLQERLGFTHVSTGALIRKEIASQSSLGKSVKAIVESGNYVDDKTIVACLLSHLSTFDHKANAVVLLDGIPRNIIQAEELKAIFGKQFQGVIALSADLEQLSERFIKRWSCTKCGKIESFDEAPSQDYVCPSCSAVSSYARRKDDEPEVVKSRLKIYTKQTEPLVDFYKKENMLYTFDALAPIEEIYVAIASLILQKVHGNS